MSHLLMNFPFAFLPGSPWVLCSVISNLLTVSLSSLSLEQSETLPSYPLSDRAPRVAVSAWLCTQCRCPLSSELLWTTSLASTPEPITQPEFAIGR